MSPGFPVCEHPNLRYGQHDPNPTLPSWYGIDLSCQGAGQAIEDAATLILLTRTADSPDKLRMALTRYDAARKPRTTALWRRSRLVARIAQLSNPIAAGLRDTALLATPGTSLARAAAAVPRSSNRGWK